MSSKPHSIEDNEPPGVPAIGETTTEAYSMKEVTVIIDFDDAMSEFRLWDKLYDASDYGAFEMTAKTDFEKRIQFYFIKSSEEYITKFISWLKENEFDFDA